jgi:integrase
MPSLNTNRGRLVYQFQYRGVVCREPAKLKATRDNRKLAKAILRDIVRELLLGTFDYAKRFPGSKRLKKFGIRPAVAPATVKEYFARWLDTLELSKASRYDYECLGRAFIDRTVLGAMPLDTVTAADIREAFKPVVTAGKTRRVTMALQRLRSMYDGAIEDGLCEMNPARRVKNPKPGRRLPKEPLSTREDAAILRAAEGQDRNMIAVLIGSGVRPGELLTVRRADVDLKNRKMVISASLGRFGEGPTKTANSARVVNLSDATIAALRDQMKAPRLHGPLFANASGGFLNYTNWRDRNWTRLLTKASENEVKKEREAIAYRSPYVCRHTYAVRMLEAGHDPIMVAKQMGHTSPQMIYRHYSRWINSVQIQPGATVVKGKTR